MFHCSLDPDNIPGLNRCKTQKNHRKCPLQLPVFVISVRKFFTPYGFSLKQIASSCIFIGKEAKLYNFIIAVLMVQYNIFSCHKHVLNDISHGTGTNLRSHTRCPAINQTEILRPSIKNGSSFQGWSNCCCPRHRLVSRCTARTRMHMNSAIPWHHVYLSILFLSCIIKI